VGAPAALGEALRRVDAAGGFGWPDDRSPFPGLRPFDIEQHQVFFGRVSETEELAELLRSAVEQTKEAALLVVGPSGRGKSSLVRVGLEGAGCPDPPSRHGVGRRECGHWPGYCGGHHWFVAVGHRR
jgi:hypothetical protein